MACITCRSLTLTLCLLGVVVSSHWFACVFFVINNAAVGDEWLAASGVDAAAVTVSDQYIAAFYWAIMTMTTVGFGDVVPVSTGGRFFAIFVMIFGAGVFAFGVTNVVRIVGSLNETESLFREKMDRIRSSKLPIPGALGWG